MSPLRILVADDEPLVRDALRLVLTKLGHAPTCVEDGRKAVDALMHQPYDLVITDLLMPDFDGLELITEMRRMRANIPVIAISGGGRIAGNEYLRMAKRLGAVAVLSKPFTPDDVVEVIRTAFPSAA